uniref:Uncharacterized protein n=1 Tax=Vespula pensylvanica TaxID=30213 RepID=A0A834KCK3_VESPE|nr:hypothetical protein H0235_014965 [Vespula pensylvanica]
MTGLTNKRNYQELFKSRSFHHPTPYYINRLHEFYGINYVIDEEGISQTTEAGSERSFENLPMEFHSGIELGNPGHQVHRYIGEEA